MKKRRAANSRNRSALGFEALEDRRMLAGNVTTAFDATTGLLTITGDAAANDIAVERSGNQTYNVVGNATGITGNTTFTKVTSINVVLGDGADAVEFRNDPTATNPPLDLPLDSVVVNTGAESDTITVANLLTRTLEIEGGSGANNVTVNNNEILGNLSLTTGSGGPQVIAVNANRILGDLRANIGAGGENSQVTGNTVKGRVLWQGDAGVNNVNFTRNFIDGTFRVDTGAEGDIGLFLLNTVGGQTDIGTGSGDDLLQVFGNAFLRGANFRAGEGTNTATFGGGNVFDGLFFYGGGSGVDTVNVDDSLIDVGNQFNGVFWINTESGDDVVTMDGDASGNAASENIFKNRVYVFLQNGADTLTTNHNDYLGASSAQFFGGSGDDTLNRGLGDEFRRNPSQFSFQFFANPAGTPLMRAPAAGNLSGVQFDFSAEGVLTLTGTAADDAITVNSQGLNNLQVDVGGTQQTFNRVTAVVANLGDGANTFSLAAASFTGELPLERVEVTGGQNDDTISITGNIRTLSVNAGEGNNFLLTPATIILGDLVFNSGGGNDNYQLFFNAVMGNSRISSGAGEDSVTIFGSFCGNLFIDSGSENDVIVVSGLVGGATQVETRDGSDTFIAGSLRQRGSANFNLGDGDDLGGLLNNYFAQGANLRGGEGTNRASVGGGNAFDGMFFYGGGSGVDLVSVDDAFSDMGNQFQSWLWINTNSGDDIVAVDGDRFVQNTAGQPANQATENQFLDRVYVYLGNGNDSLLTNNNDFTRSKSVRVFGGFGDDTLHNLLSNDRTNGGLAQFSIQDFKVVGGQPNAVNDTFNNVANPQNLPVLNNDTDPENDPLSLIHLIPQVRNLGTGVIAGNQVAFTPSPNMSGSDTFLYTVTDGNGGLGTANITVNVNRAPTAGNDGVAFGEDDGARNITGEVSGNDTDPDVNDTLAITAINTAGTLGLVTLNAGVLTYNPNGQFESLGQGQTATDTFTYTVTDSSPNQATATATVTVTINGVNDAPVITTNNLNAPENQTAGGAVIATDVDIPANTLTFSLVAGTGSEDNNLFTISGAGVLTFNAAPDFENPGDADNNNVYNLRVRVTDGTVPVEKAITVTVTDVNDAPTILTDNLNAAENQTAAGTVQAADQDIPPNTLTFSLVAGTGSTDNGLFSISAAGALTFNAAPDFENPADNGGDNVYNVRVNVNDGTADVQKAITVTVADANDPAVITTVNLNAAENQTAAGTVAATDQDVPADTLSFSLIGGTGSEDNGLFSISAAGVLTFNAAPDFENPADADTNNVYNVRVRVNDGTDNTDKAITVTVTDVNDPPVITTVNLNAAENQTAAGTVVATDQDLPADPLTFSLVAGAGNEDNGLFTISPAGVLTFNAAPDFENPTDADTNNVYNVRVNVNDGTTNVEKAITVTVTDANDPAVITTVNLNAAENQIAAGTVQATDQDIPADVLIFSLASGTGSQDNGLFSISAAGVLTFNAAPDFENPADNGANNVYNVRVRVNDGTVNTDKAITVTVTDVNDAPVITTDNLNAAENQTAAGTVVATDQDVPADVLTFSLVGGAGSNDNGLFSISAAGVLTFNAAPDFENPADGNTDNVYNVRVRVNDGTVNTDKATTVTVTDVNEAPVAQNNAFSTPANTLFNGNLITDVDPTDGADSDADAGDTLTILKINGTNTTHTRPGDPLGQLIMLPTTNSSLLIFLSGMFQYTPANGIAGPESFTYTIEDSGGLESNTATVTFTIT